MSITWKHYSGRAGVGLKRFLEGNKDVKSYKDLCDTLKARGVDVPPTEEEYAALAPKPKKVDMFKPKQKATTRKAPNKNSKLGIRAKAKATDNAKNDK